MPVTYELLETFIGTRTIEAPDMQNDGETVSEEVTVRDIQVRFTSDSPAVTHERTVNVCFDADGAYDAAATLVRIGQVAMGVENKIAAGVVS